MSDQVIALLVQDNLDLACQAIEKAARERATLEVEEGFASAFDTRRRHREVCIRICTEAYKR
jgi:CCR4-NOT transcription complex subunit 1